MTEALQVEATGETVGEAKWAALRELEKLQPGIDKTAVQFQVLSEGERGLLGVGYAPARVIASVDPGAVAERRHERLFVLAQTDLGIDADRIQDPLDHLAHLPAELGVVLGGLGLGNGTRVDR